MKKTKTIKTKSKAIPLINKEEVRKLFLECLDMENGKIINGHNIQTKLTVNNSQREQIIKWLDCLPEKFRNSVSGGCYWQDALEDKNGILWAYKFGYLDELILLGQAIGRIVFTLPREDWKSCQGGIPPFVYLDRITRLNRRK